MSPWWCPQGPAVNGPFSSRPVPANRAGCRAAATCARTAWRCTTAALGRGRTVSIAEDEPFQQRLRQRAATRAGRAQLRQRVEVEHRLAHLGARQGRRARYKGVRKNLFDVRCTAAVLNLETMQRKIEAQELRMAA